MTVDTCSSPARLRSSPLLGLPRMNVMPFSSSGDVSRSARITISRWSSTSRARSSRTISDPLRFHPQTSTCPVPLYVPMPAPCLMTVATKRDAMVAVPTATRLTPATRTSQYERNPNWLRSLYGELFSNSVRNSQP